MTRNTFVRVIVIIHLLLAKNAATETPLYYAVARSQGENITAVTHTFATLAVVWTTTHDGTQ
jgi:hypothetical protein